MLSYLRARLFTLIISVLLSSFTIFVLIEVVPGDPASFMLGINATEETVESLRKELGLDHNFLNRYLDWSIGMLSGDFGISYTYRVPVQELIMERLKVSLPLATLSLTLSIFIAFPVGMLAVQFQGKKIDHAIMVVSQIGIAIPNFWFAMILVLIFSINLQWFSAGGFYGWESGFLMGLKSLILPAIALALPQASILSRIIRSAILNTLMEDYIRTARSKGLSLRQVIPRHALRNALIPVLTILGLQFSFLLAGAIIIENVFFLPGLGRLIFQAITQRDLIVVESAVMLLVFSVIMVNFIVDLLYILVDPRLRK
ncbi:MAG: peptide ABC transporter [Rhodobacteraceae bacterium]|nr:MAG: peptide ABC transporter [Paracoccaceae bacterium]